MVRVYHIRVELSAGCVSCDIASTESTCSNQTQKKRIGSTEMQQSQSQLYEMLFTWYENFLTLL